MKSNPVVLITGASRGIGAATAIYFLASAQASFTTGGFIDVAGGL